MKLPGRITLAFLLFFLLTLGLVFSLGKQKCVDTEKVVDCVIWKNAGFCKNETHREYMELYCNKTCDVCESHVRPCPKGYFSCLGGLPACVQVDKMCDCKQDCENGHDEYDCQSMGVNCDAEVNATEVVISFNATEEAETEASVQPPNESNDTFVFDMNEEPYVPPSPGDPGIPCPARHTACISNKQCINIKFWCDGWIKDCPDGEDEREGCYKRVNLDFFQTSSVSAITSVKSFFVAFQRMNHAHCPMRAFSCEGACMDDVDLNKYQCACDPQCWMRGDCCHDIEKKCPEHARPKGVIERCSPNLFGKEESLSALMVDQCPGSATVYDDARCKERDKPETIQFYGAPVYSPDEDKHYRNYYCAKCNKVQTANLVPWNVWYACQSTEADFDEDCDSFIYIPPLNHPPKTCRIKVFQDPSFEATVITTAQRDGRTVERCQTVYAPVKYNETLYRNPYCLYMHRYQVGDTNMSRLHTCDIDQKLADCKEGFTPCRPTFSCLPEDKVCNGEEDCGDRSDEPESCRETKLCYPKFQCKRTQHECFDRYKVCNKRIDCKDGSDEADCPDDDNERTTPRYMDNFHASFSRLSKYPRISNTYKEKSDSRETATSAMTKKLPKCIDPLVFDGNNCTYNGKISTNKKYEEVRFKQEISITSYNITLSPLEHHRPSAMSDNPVTFLTKRLNYQPYQVVGFEMSKFEPGKPREVRMSVREYTKLERNRGAEDLVRTKRFQENNLQIGNVVYQIRATRDASGSNIKGKQLKTLINCEFDSSGAHPRVLCTGCAHVEYSSREYNITTSGSLQLTGSGEVLHYYEYELRAKGTILMCWDSPTSNPTEPSTEDRDKRMKVWFGVGYSLALLVHFVALNMNLFYGRRTTLRIFFINFTTMGVIWSFDALLCTVSSVYSIAARSLHLYGSLGALTWLLIISFHLLISVSDGSPAVYFSVDNLVFYHVCGWLAPLGWVLLFFLLSTFKVVEYVVCLTDSRLRQGLTLNQSSEILHFPVWVLIVITFFVLVIVIGATKRLMSGKTGKVDLEVMGGRLQIKMMVFVLFLLQSLPWIITLCLKYFAEDFEYHNAVFCLCCVIEGFYLIYMLRALVDQDLEKIRNLTPTPDNSLQKITPSPNSELSRTPEMKPKLPPKTTRGPRPPLYQRPVDHAYTPFPDHHKSGIARDTFPLSEPDQYSHLQGGHLGGNRNGKKKDYYPVTQLGTSGSPGQGSSRKGSVPAQTHQYMPLVRNEKNCSPAEPGTRSRQRTTSGQGSNAVSQEPVYHSTSQSQYSDKGKHRAPRSTHPSDQSNTPSVQMPGFEQNDNPPPYRVSGALYPDTQPCSSNDGQLSAASNSNQGTNTAETLPPNYSQSFNLDKETPPDVPSVDPFKSSYC